MSTTPKQYSDESLYLQLLYLISIFSPTKALQTIAPSSTTSTSGPNKDELEALATQNKHAFDLLRGVAQKYLDVNGRGCVELRRIFGFMAPRA